MDSSFFSSTGGGMFDNHTQFSGNGMAGFHPRGPRYMVVEDDDDDGDD
jgi:hypothetical protein